MSSAHHFYTMLQLLLSNIITRWLQGISDDISASLAKSKGEQKKEEELEQAKSDSGRWAKHLSWDWKEKRVA